MDVYDEIDTKKITKVIAQLGHQINEEELKQVEVLLVLKFFFDKLNPSLKNIAIETLTYDVINNFIMKENIKSKFEEHI